MPGLDARAAVPRRPGCQDARHACRRRVTPATSIRHPRTRHACRAKRVVHAAVGCICQLGHGLIYEGGPVYNMHGAN